MKRMDYLHQRFFALVLAVLLMGCGGGSEVVPASTPTQNPPVTTTVPIPPIGSNVLPQLQTDGARWVDANGKQVILKGTNLGNWLVQEFWMMGLGGNGVTNQCTLEEKLTERFGYAEKERLIKLFRDNWITERDWDQLKAFGFNVVRLPILWSVIEDERSPKTLRADAWTYLDWSIAQAKKRGMYVILDLHGAYGGQTSSDHTGCGGQNKYWADPIAHDRTRWLWQQIATKYKDEPAVAAYDPLNEPWGSTAQAMVTRIEELYWTIRAIDSKRIILLPSHYGSIAAYGNPIAKGLTNVAFQIHPYPGLFGDRPGDPHYLIHRDWLRCGQTGNRGVCAYDAQISNLRIPLLVGEFQPWRGAGLDLGGQIARATYDTYASYGWAATSWAYKVVSNTGGSGNGTWGMVTNAVNSNSGIGVSMLARASTASCPGWNTSFEGACNLKSSVFKVEGAGPKSYYLFIKSGAASGGRLDMTFDNISLTNVATKAEVVTNGGFGSNSRWTSMMIRGRLDLDFNHTALGRAPTQSEGAVLRVIRPIGLTGGINGGIYQNITLQGGQSYTLNGVFKDNDSSNAWAEIYLLEREPVQGRDFVTKSGTLDFATAALSEIEALFRSYASQAYEVHAGLEYWLTSNTQPEVFQLPAAPKNLMLSASSTGNALTWSAATDPKVVAYNVYRAPNAGGNYSKLAENVVGTSYTDLSSSSDANYYYVVTSLTTINESYHSDSAATAVHVPIPATLEAEAYSAMSGIQLENCSDIGGGHNISNVNFGDYLEYKVKVPTNGRYNLNYRIATARGSTGFEVWIDDVRVVDAMAIPLTGGWQTWVTQTSPSFFMPAGEHTLRLRSVGRDWNMNWLRLNAL
jgi:glucan 1,3-beta-glucosidase